LSNVISGGIHTGGLTKIKLGSFNEVEIIHNNGITKMEEKKINNMYVIIFPIVVVVD